MTSVIRVHLLHEVFHIIVGKIARDIFSQDCFDFLKAHHVTLFLIENFEAFFSLVFASALGSPSVCDNVLAEAKVDAVALRHEFSVALDKVGIDFTLAQSVEAKVVEDVTEMGDRNVAGLFFVVEVEGLSQVEHLVAGQGVCIHLLSIVASTIDLLFLSCFLTRHLKINYT